MTFGSETLLPQSLTMSPLPNRPLSSCCALECGSGAIPASCLRARDLCVGDLIERSGCNSREIGRSLCTGFDRPRGARGVWFAWDSRAQRAHDAVSYPGSSWRHHLSTDQRYGGTARRLHAAAASPPRCGGVPSARMPHAVGCMASMLTSVCGGCWVVLLPLSHSFFVGVVG